MIKRTLPPLESALARMRANLAARVPDAYDQICDHISRNCTSELKHYYNLSTNEIEYQGESTIEVLTDQFGIVSVLEEKRLVYLHEDTLVSREFEFEFRGAEQQPDGRFLVQVELIDE